MKKHRTTIALSALIALAGCGKEVQVDPRTQAPLVAVTILKVPSDARQSFTGVVRARVESDLGFRVPGKIVERLVDAGQTVKLAQPLMRLDPTDLTLEASTQLSDVATARVRAAQAEADLKRLEGLVEAGAVSAQTYDQAKAIADSARAQFDAAEAQARVATNAQRYAVLLADADGVVEDTSGELGQVVAAGQRVVRLAHAGPREAAVNLPETIRPPIGSSAIASLYGSANAQFGAHLRQLSQSADPATRTFEARYVLDGQGATAPLGTTVTVALTNQQASDAAVEAPLTAIFDPGGGPGVWRVENDTVRFQPIAIMSIGAETARISGVSAGAQIVALGADRLREGQQVRAASFPTLAVDEAAQ
jgi:RND family efflux transporter MFP subunit